MLLSEAMQLLANLRLNLCHLLSWHPLQEITVVLHSDLLLAVEDTLTGRQSLQTSVALQYNISHLTSYTLTLTQPHTHTHTQPHIPHHTVIALQHKNNYYILTSHTHTIQLCVYRPVADDPVVNRTTFQVNS